MHNCLARHTQACIPAAHFLTGQRRCSGTFHFARLADCVAEDQSDTEGLLVVAQSRGQIRMWITVCDASPYGLQMDVLSSGCRRVLRNMYACMLHQR